jgi:hypothetical protein
MAAVNTFSELYSHRDTERQPMVRELWKLFCTREGLVAQLIVRRERFSRTTCTRPVFHDVDKREKGALVAAVSSCDVQPINRLLAMFVPMIEFHSPIDLMFSSRW